jgi:pantothenate kinase
MITKQQRKKLKGTLGYHYTSDVLKNLTKHGITNRKGVPYGSSMIRNVYNGLNENIKLKGN